MEEQRAADARENEKDENERQIDMLDKGRARMLVMFGREDMLCPWDVFGERTAEGVLEGGGGAQLVVVEE